MNLTHFSLFTGIGGIDLAAEWAGFKTVGQCEFADYPTKVLEKHWPDVPRWRDVRDVTIKSVHEKGIGKVTLLSGGFPCQPHSVAGKRKASGDERNLWPEYRRIIGEVKPKWVLAENVRGLLSSEDGRFFGGILNDLADLGYDAGWCCYGANRVGAIHRRERVFIIAYSNSSRFMEHKGFKEKIQQSWDKKLQQEEGRQSIMSEPLYCAENDTDSHGQYVERSRKNRYQGSRYYKGSFSQEALRNGEEDPRYINPNYVELIMGFPDRWTDLNV